VGAIIVDKTGQILLVRHTYLTGWSLPGGGVKRKETILEAIKRELKEELDLDCLSDPELIGPALLSAHESRSVHNNVFLVTDWERNSDRVQKLEIEEVGFFDVESLPEGTIGGTRRRIDEYLQKRKADYRW